MRITLYGFLQYDPTLFDDITLPDDLDKDTVINEIIRRSGDLFPYHQALPYLKQNITFWFNRNYINFDRMIAALTAEYNPIENYDRYQKDTTTPTEVVTTAHTGTITDKDSGKDSREIKSTPGVTDTTETKVSAFDSSSYSPSEQTSLSHTGFDSSTDDLTHGKQTQTTFLNTDTVTNSGKRDFESRVHGNIGVTTSQQMINAELELRKFDIYTDIARRFEKEFLIQIY